MFKLWYSCQLVPFYSFTHHYFNFFPHGQNIWWVKFRALHIYYFLSLFISLLSGFMLSHIFMSEWSVWLCVEFWLVTLWLHFALTFNRLYRLEHSLSLSCTTTFASTWAANQVSRSACAKYKRWNLARSTFYWTFGYFSDLRQNN